VTLVGGQPYGNKKKGADTGIDGYLYFMDEKDKVKKAIISVKGGEKVSVTMIGELGHVIDRERAEIGIFLTLAKPTKPMLKEAALKGFYKSPMSKHYSKIQILTIEQLVHGQKLDIPPWISPVQAPSSSKKDKAKSLEMI
jgi:site-specific DNA-methyltransferase (adenine-specific)